MKTLLTTITTRETQGTDRKNEPVTIGIPFPEGLVHNPSDLILRDQGDNNLPLQTEVLATWSDKSLKWVLLDFQASVSSGEEVELPLLLDASRTASDGQSAISVQETEDQCIVDTKAAAFFVSAKGTFRPFERVVVEGKEILHGEKSRILLTDEDGNEYEPVIHKIFLETRGKQRTTLKAEGEFISEDQSVFAAFSSRISFFANHSMIRMTFTILNPRAAKHPGGLWDLGDPGSVFFKDISLSAALDSHENMKISWCLPPGDAETIASDHLRIYQDSSGGENWDSRNHVNRNNEVRTSFRGYQVYANDEIIQKGTRANPTFSIKNGDKKISGSVQHFWQNFPKALEADGNTLTIRLFPEQYDDVFELQGGEQKTHTIFLDFGLPEAEGPGLEWIHSQLIAHATPDWYSKSEAFSYLIPEREDSNRQLNELITTAIRGDKTFFQRREIIDEYGWRNFGELYADHEAVGYKGPAPLISHYNNQYDCIYGMLFQFARSGEDQWFLLADQLCRHMKDIDIYHTDEDRPEYNRGLFWHTEHYIDVQTASHRCFSKRHADQRNLAAYGGGPALSHIYSAGLLLHYYMTGDPSSKEAVSDLASFVVSNMEMESTFLNQTIKGVRAAKLFLKSTFGEKDLVQLGKVYELDGPGRASGNVLSVLTDAYVLTEDQRYLEKADHLICRCIHPDDDIEKRDLTDVENRWMYVVFLQSLGKYLDMKTRHQMPDDMWEYARQSLIHYAKWMLDNEYPYLEKPEKLEFPNETWATQDIRKCNVLLYAGKYADDVALRDIFMEKAEFFYEEAISYLFKFETRTRTRPIILAMLNGMMPAYAKAHGIKPVIYDEFPEYGDSSRIHAGMIEKRQTSKNIIINMLNTFSLSREIRFLKWRL
ncbi:MAG: hypothetical protein DRI57_01000 [Deltaproteobacteria bacterium]|nr:MAG: hypothetical protein DRI57_01000 [Deltaproteobacteria bacterium]